MFALERHPNRTDIHTDFCTDYAIDDVQLPCAVQNLNLRNARHLRRKPAVAILRKFTTHQDTWQCQVGFHRNVDFPNRIEARRSIETLSVQGREAVQLAYRE